MTIKDRRSITSPTNGINGGVKTIEGKAISSQNSLKHGILANFSTHFDDLSFEETYKLYADEFGDYSTSRKTLIEQLVISQIRLRRCARFEAEFINEKLNPPKYERRLVNEGIHLRSLEDEYENVLIDSGEPMTMHPKTLDGLENLYSKYEPQFLSRFFHILDYLTRSAK